MKEQKARVEDALHATRAAVEEGIVPGGGVAGVADLVAHSPTRPEAGAYPTDELEKVVDTVLEHVSDDRDVDGRVAVDQNVAETDGAAKGRREVVRNPSGPAQELEQLLVRRCFPETFVAHDVRGHVLAGLQCDLQAVLDEATLFDIGLERVCICKLSKLAHAGLDEGELR